MSNTFLHRMKPPEIIETPRLSLRRPIAADAIAIFEGYAQDPEVTRYLPWQPHKQIHETDEFLDRCAAGWDDSSEFTWVLVRKPDCQLLGMVALRVGQYNYLRLTFRLTHRVPARVPICCPC